MNICILKKLQHFSEVLVQLHTPISSVSEFQLLHIFNSIWFSVILNFAILVAMKLSLIMFFICISLMVDEFELLSMCLLVIPVSCKTTVQAHIHIYI